MQYNTFLNCEGALTLRHGNRCTVQGNFFLGNSKRNTGGVRIIGEDHKVYNNYFVGLAGDGARSALSMMNGIPGSPLNGYFQVKRAVVAFNTFVDCRSNLLLGLVGSNPKGGTLSPEDCIIANNIVNNAIRSDKAPLVQGASKLLNLRWRANLMHGGDLGIDPTSGIQQVDPQLKVAADGLWRPTGASAVLGGAVADLSFVSDDIDGQQRGAKPDIGCDQVSDKAVHRQPLTPDMIGPAWRKTP